MQLQSIGSCVRHLLVVTSACASLALVPLPAALAVPAVQFETELVSLSLTGSGMLPVPIGGGMFQEFPVLLDIRPSPGQRHLGRLTATPLPGGTEFQVDSFFDVFFDVTFAHPGGAPFLVLPGLHDQLSGHWLGQPDAHGLFSPAGGPYFGGQTLPGVPIADSFFDITYRIDVTLNAGDPIPTENGFRHTGDVFAVFSGEINPPFGPFALGGTFELTQTLVPVPAALWLFAGGFASLAAFRRKA